MSASTVDKDGVKQTTTTCILHNFVEFLLSNYVTIQVDNAYGIRMEEAVHRTLQLGWRDCLNTLVTEEELKGTVSIGPYSWDGRTA